MIRFYFGSGSPFAWRVHLVLEEKALVYEPVLLSFQRGDLKTPEHLARSPHGKVPALSDGPCDLYESTAIVEYLEEQYPTPTLLPAAAARARVRIEELEAVDYFATAFRAVAQLAFFTPPERRDADALARARAALRTELERLEARAVARGERFIAGPSLTRADLTWLPFVEIGARAGVELDATTPWLVDWRTRLRGRPSYARSYPPHWHS